MVKVVPRSTELSITNPGPVIATDRPLIDSPGGMDAPTGHAIRDKDTRQRADHRRTLPALCRPRTRHERARGPHLFATSFEVDQAPAIILTDVDTGVILGTISFDVR